VPASVHFRRSIRTVVALGDAAIATSGDHRNFLVEGGKRYSHTIDPRTGKPVTYALASAGVIKPSTMFADALATAIVVPGPEAGFRLAVSEKIAAQLVVKSLEEFQAWATPEFQRCVIR
jgi:thiamine biosynthesis lipoprotein